MSVAEGLAAGVPVVVTKRSGWAEVDAAGCGFSVGHEPVSIADGILRVLDHADPEAMRMRASTWAKQKYGWEAIGRAMRDAYEQAIARAPRRVA